VNWLLLLAAFAIAALAGAFVAGVLERSRKQWSKRRRLWTAAFALPCVVLAATAAGIAWVVISGPGSGENMQDFAIAATALVGGLFTIIALVGGIVGVSFAQGRKSS
jgi:hypothetical protein